MTCEQLFAAMSRLRNAESASLRAWYARYAAQGHPFALTWLAAHPEPDKRREKGK